MGAEQADGVAPQEAQTQQPLEVQLPACPACGELNRGDALFCRGCGGSLVPVSATPEVAEPSPVDVEERHAVGAGFSLPAGRWRIVAAAITAALLVLVVVLVLSSRGGRGSDRASELQFATVRRGDIQSFRSFDGEIGSTGDGPPVISRLSGTITDIAAAETKVGRGEALFSVDGAPVLLLYGTLPAWRDVGPGVTPGADVKQVEENLDALGYDVGTPDERFTEATTAAIDGWLESLGLPRAGLIRLGRVVFARGELTVEEPLKRAGEPVADGEDVLATVSEEKVVIVELEEEGQLPVGTKVRIALPARKFPAKVTSVGRSDEGQEVAGDRPTTQAVVVPDQVGVLAGLRDGADADVEIPQETRENVLLVPVTALVARQDGSYAVEVPTRDGTRLVAVTVGLYSGDTAEVRSGVREGDRVVVP